MSKEILKSFIREAVMSESRFGLGSGGSSQVQAAPDGSDPAADGMTGGVDASEFVEELNSHGPIDWAKFDSLNGERFVGIEPSLGRVYRDGTNIWVCWNRAKDKGYVFDRFIAMLLNSGGKGIPSKPFPHPTAPVAKITPLVTKSPSFSTKVLGQLRTLTFAKKK